MPANRLVPTPAPSDTPSYKILVDGNELNSAYRVLTINVVKELSKISQAEISLLDGDVSTETFDVSDTPDLIPGKKVEITAGYQGQNSTIFKGIIVKHGIQVLQNASSVLTITAKHEAFTSTLVRKNSTFAEKKDSEAIDDILGKANLQKEVEATNIKHESLVQYNCTDWDFVNMRAEANGKVVILTDDKVVVKKPNLSAKPKLQLYYGSSILEFEAEMDGRNAFKKYVATSWDQAGQKVEKVEEAEGAVASAQGNMSISDLAKAVGNDQFNIHVNASLKTDETTELAKALVLKNNLAKIRGRVKCIGFADIIPGDMVNLNGVGSRFNGDAFVSGVRHAIYEGNWETDIQFGLDNQLYSHKYDNITEKPASGILPNIHGLQIGEVIQLKDDPAGEDRVLVKLPMIETGSDTFWARVATLDAGKERGSFFRPELHDEVILGFIDDDPRKAVVLGMLNSSKLPAPVAATDENDEKGFYTREKMKFVFNDKEKSITLETPGGNKIIVSDDAKGIALNDQNGNKITLDDKGITIESAKDIKIKASGDINAEGVNVNIKASAMLKGEGSSGAQVQSSANTVIKGSLVQIN